MKPIPHIDLAPANAPLRAAFFRGLRTLYARGSFSGGEYVERFESDFAAYLGARHCVGLNSGTSAVHLALVALEIGPGDEVVVPAYTFAGSAWGILYCGATPVFADVDARTGNLDPEAVERALTPRTRAIIAVHLFGQGADMIRLKRIARARKLVLIEDAAQAHGLRIGTGGGKRAQAGVIGDIGCFSFYPTKNLGGIGEAGAVVTGNREWAERIRLLRSHNSPRRFDYAGIGYNYRMDAVQALFLRLKLARLDAMNADRRRLARAYLAALGDGPLRPLCSDPEASVWHAFVVATPARAAFLKRMDAAGIGHAIYYPGILPRAKPFRPFAPDARKFPGALALARANVSLPFYAGMREADADRVTRMLRAEAGKRPRATPREG